MSPSVKAAALEQYDDDLAGEATRLSLAEGDTGGSSSSSAAATGAASSSVEENVCIICLDDARSVAFGCGHLCCCGECADELKECPVCRARIKQRLRIYT